MARSRQTLPSETEPAEPLVGFHEGTSAAFELCYRDHFDTVDAAVGRILRGADRETVVHDVFARLMADRGLRESFRGGSLGAWLATVARNLAIDFARRQRFESPAGALPGGAARQADDEALERGVEVRLLVERFRRECLPSRWAPVFEARFLLQLDQPEAARRLGISRTTLAYQEYRVRRLLRRFALKGRSR
jgi:RNA polymerase sigma-70 factor (ECF subfamily)